MLQIRKANRRRILFSLLGIFTVIALVSATLGRDLYMDAPPNMITFALIHFCGYLFFLLMPVELLYIYYLTEDVNPLLLTTIALSTAVVAQVIDYWCGYLVRHHFLESIISRRQYLIARRFLNQYGNVSMLIFNVLPLSSPILIVVAASLRYRLYAVLLYSIPGLIIKYSVINWMFS